MGGEQRAEQTGERIVMKTRSVLYSQRVEIAYQHSCESGIRPLSEPEFLEFQNCLNLEIPIVTKSDISSATAEE
jgi:hypothetical protein